jgi:hypothetical protein
MKTTPSAPDRAVAGALYDAATIYSRLDLNKAAIGLMEAAGQLAKMVPQLQRAASAIVDASYGKKR